MILYQSSSRISVLLCTDFQPAEMIVFTAENPFRTSPNYYYYSHLDDNIYSFSFLSIAAYSPIYFSLVFRTRAFVSRHFACVFDSIERRVKPSVKLYFVYSLICKQKVYRRRRHFPRLN